MTTTPSFALANAANPAKQDLTASSLSTEVATPVISQDITVRDIAETRAEMSETIRAIEERLAPSHLREQLMEQLDEARATFRVQMKEEIAELEGTVKTAVKAELVEIKESVLVEIADIKEVLQTEFINARVALRAATIGKVETMVRDAKSSANQLAITAASTANQLARDAASTANQAGTSMVTTMRANPVPTALIGVGLAWLLFKTFVPNRRATRRASSDPRIGVRQLGPVLQLAQAPQAPLVYSAGLGPRFDP